MVTLREKVFIPVTMELRQIISEILELPLDTRACINCATSVLAQILHYSHYELVVKDMGTYVDYSKDSLSEIAGHIFNFSYAGIEQRKKMLSL